MSQDNAAKPSKALTPHAKKEFNRQTEDARKLLESNETDEERIYRYRLEGASPREISTRPGINRTPEQVEEVIGGMAERSRQRIASELSIASILELDRMDALQSALWVMASQEGDFGAIDRVMSIAKERRKLLGLDAPEVKASLNLNSEADQLDLSVLSIDEMKVFQRIQEKLKVGHAKNTMKTLKAAPKT